MYILIKMLIIQHYKCERSQFFIKTVLMIVTLNNNNRYT